MSIRLTSVEQERLVLENIGFVKYTVRKLNINFSDYEDLVSIGTIGLIKAAATFDKSKGEKFIAYAKVCIDNELLMHFRNEKSHRNDISLEEPIISDGEGNQKTLMAIIPCANWDFTEKIAETDILITLVNVVLNCLSPREKFIMLHQIAGTKQADVAEMLKCTQPHISRLEKQINKKVKSYFTRNRKFEKVFSMTMADNMYQIVFSTKDVTQFNMIFATVLEKITLAEDLPNFNISCNNGRIIIRVPAHLKSFSFIAKIIKEIDDFSMTFMSNKSVSSEKVDKVIVKEESQAKKVRDYIAGQTTFRIQDIKENFPNVTIRNIRHILAVCKKKGMISSTIRGEYVVNKT